MNVSVEKESELKSGSRRVSSPLKLTILSLFAAVLLALVLRVDHQKQTRDEVARVELPDGSASALVYELTGDAKSPFDYEVDVAADGKTQVAAYIAGAKRNDRAYGVDLRWLSNSDLSVEYLTAQNASAPVSQIVVGGSAVRVSLHPGVRNDKALPGGMLFNLQHAHDVGF
jgi:hypothetical protein